MHKTEVGAFVEGYCTVFQIQWKPGSLCTFNNNSCESELISLS